MALQQAPNIVLVIADDLGIGDPGAYGGKLVRTRTIDRLARTGVTCTTMYAAAATDTPSRAGILTGRFGARFGLPASLQPGAATGLPTDVPTVASALRAAGYATGLFGQWRLGSGAGQHPLDKGFDRFAGTLYGSDVSPLAWYEDRDEVDPAINLGLATRRITDAAEDFLAGLGGRRRTQRPFFAVLSHLVPHAPFAADPEYAGRSRAGLYGDVVEALDDHLEQLLRAIRRRTGGEDTLVIVTSDNGALYEGSNLDLRGRKPEVMDGGVLVPFIASWLRGGRRITDDTPRSLLDLTPTLCALAGAPPPDDLDGDDMSALLDGSGPAPRGPVYLYYNEWLNAARSGRWKLHVAYGNDARAYMPALYDVLVDRRESNNVAELFPDVVAALTPPLEAVRADVSAEATARAAGGAA